MSSLSRTTQASSGDDNTQSKFPIVREESRTMAFPKSEGFQDLYTALTLSLGTARLNLDYVQCEGTLEEKAPALHQAFNSLVTAGELLPKFHRSQKRISEGRSQTERYKIHVERLVEDMDSTFEAYSDESKVLSTVLKSKLRSERGPLAFLVQEGDDGK
jgi:hypothetical protein